MISSERLFFSFSSFIALANFTSVSSDATLLEGQDLQLFCIASGRPGPNITWVRISPSGIMRDLLHRGTTWDFKKISRAEAGTYRCIANNGIEDPVSHTINVTVLCEYKLCNKLCSLQLVLNKHVHVVRKNLFSGEDTKENLNQATYMYTCTVGPWYKNALCNEVLDVINYNMLYFIILYPSYSKTYGKELSYHKTLF